jgi:exosortase
LPIAAVRETGPSSTAVWGRLMISVGLLLLIAPTVYRLATLSWTTAAGAHGPIVLATGLWLIWRDPPKAPRSAPGPWPACMAVLLITLALYCYARITSSLAIEAIALYAAIAAIVFWRYGTDVLLKYKFVLIYFLFLIAPPFNYLAAVTQPLKLIITELAVDFLSLFGLPVAHEGVVIQAGPYELLVATACAGLNSILSLSAISLFYVYIRHGSDTMRASILIALIIPIAIALNLVRVILLILITYYGGVDIGSGFAHLFTGVGLFAIALVAFFCVDSLIDLAMRHRLTAPC